MKSMASAVAEAEIDERKVMKEF